ncbi:TonB-dependent receptor [Asticcacaulis excentricus CB 48]|uniref:TonB-dependent receptor n=2 Tax=Asticcacaulis excentricus TaxID=78587 RepID=E8RLJ4_ASTEC|nr:TonB-dependent receptor [Asticcacaulis excentricus CB 48]
MRKNDIKAVLLLSTTVSGLSGMSIASTAMAQTAGEEAAVEVVVTGSRIKKPNLQSSSPITTISAADIKASGATRVEDMVNTLPSVFAADGAMQSNGASGTATVNLRGLGTSRTLVLLNGSRMAPGSPVQPAADLNQIPAALIERVDILTGGASAVYGSDAMAGVVNFVMKKKFEGVRLDLNTSFYQHHNDSDYASVVSNRGFALPESNVVDGKATDVTLVAGVNSESGKGNATVYASYRTVQALLQSERDYSACTLSSFSTCGGSSTSYPGRFFTSDYAKSYTIDTSASRLASYSAATGAYNYGPLNYYQRPDEKYSLGGFITYDFSDTLHFKSEVMLTDDTSTGQIAPSGIFLSEMSINCNNPLMTTEQKTAFYCSSSMIANGDTTTVAIGRRNVEAGGRQYEMNHTSYRLRGELTGQINEVWDFSLNMQYGSTNYKQVTKNEVSLERAQKALLVVTDPSTGNAVCQSYLDGTDKNCVPYNIWSIGGVSSAALKYISAQGVQWGGTGEQIVSLNTSGDLGAYGVKLPWAGEGLKTSLGLEYRRQWLDFDADDNLRNGLLAGSGGKTTPVSGSYDVKEVFTELLVPVAQDKTLIKDLSLELGYRISDYSSFGKNDSYKAMVSYAPVEGLRFRGGYNRAVRAPSVTELYSANSVGLFDGNDGCGVDDPSTETPTYTAAQCALTGVTAAQYNNVLSSTAGQYNRLGGGNVDLKPETGDTYTFGFVYTPDFLKGFNLTVDYFNIKIEDKISSIGAQYILDQCATTGNSFYCSKVHRASGTGSLWLSEEGYIEDTLYNTGSYKTSGFDIEANYSRKLPLGRLQLSYMGTVLEELITQATDTSDPYDCAGYFDSSCGWSNPKYRHRAKATWQSPWDWDATVTWRYFGKVDNFYGPDTSGTYASSIDAYNYIDLYASYALKSNTTLRIGVNNVFDKDPPILPNSDGTNGNTYPQVYDALGRYVFAGISLSF